MIESRNRYVGELDLETKKRNGTGTFLYPNSFFQYSGEWKQNVKQGKGILYMKDGGSFEGDFINGEINGKGIRKWLNGSIYRGDFKNGEKHGVGEFFSYDGEKYIGEWEFNQRHGKGKLTESNGNFIEGTFLNHKPEGQCEIKYNDGSNYFGDLSKGLKKGSGKFFDNINKYEYEGNWDNNQKHGKGILKNLLNNYCYDGNWIEDKPGVIPNVFLTMFPAEDIQEMQKLFEEAKKDEKKKPKKQGEDEEVFKFVFPEYLEYELGGPPLRTIEIHSAYQGPDIQDPIQPTKEEIDELIKQFQKEAKKTKNPPPMPDFSKPRMITPKPNLVSNETGRKITIELFKFNDITKKTDNDPTSYKKFKIDYRADIKQRREYNEKMKEELIKQMEAEAKQEVNVNPQPVKKGGVKGKKEPKKEEPKLDDLSKVNLYDEKEDDKKKPMIISSLNGIARVEGLEFPDDFPIGRYTVMIKNTDVYFDEKINQISFDLQINPAGGDDKKKKKK